MILMTLFINHVWYLQSSKHCLFFSHDNRKQHKKKNFLAKAASLLEYFGAHKKFSIGALNIIKRKNDMKFSSYLLSSSDSAFNFDSLSVVVASRERPLGFPLCSVSLYLMLYTDTLCSQN